MSLGDAFFLSHTTFFCRTVKREITCSRGLHLTTFWRVISGWETVESQILIESDSGYFTGSTSEQNTRVKKNKRESHDMHLITFFMHVLLLIIIV